MNILIAGFLTGLGFAAAGFVFSLLVLAMLTHGVPSMVLSVLAAILVLKKWRKIRRLHEDWRALRARDITPR